MNSTALRAEELKVNGSSLVPHGTEQRRIGTGNTGMIFKNGEHENFYYGMLKHMRFQDCYHRALVYVLGISGDTRRKFKRIYDVESGCVRTECLQEGWLTSGSGRIIRMAFNLYCNDTPSVHDYEDNEEQLKECRCYGWRASGWNAPSWPVTLHGTGLGMPMNGSPWETRCW